MRPAICSTCRLAACSSMASRSFGAPRVARALDGQRVRAQQRADRGVQEEETKALREAVISQQRRHHEHGGHADPGDPGAGRAASASLACRPRRTAGRSNRPIPCPAAHQGERHSTLKRQEDVDQNAADERRGIARPGRAPATGRNRPATPARPSQAPMTSSVRSATDPTRNAAGT